jgi:predicted nucleic acid-binding protein
MIHLDTNVLIATSSLAWFEYVCGPVPESEQHLVRAAIGGQILDVDEAVAERAAALFNHGGRKRSLRTDSMIAATAILAGAELATYNAEDFASFTAHGLKLLAL